MICDMCGIFVNGLIVELFLRFVKMNCNFFGGWLSISDLIMVCINVDLLELVVLDMILCGLLLFLLSDFIFKNSSLLLLE